MSKPEITPSNASQVLDALYDQALERLLYNTDWRDYLSGDELAQYEAAMKVVNEQPEGTPEATQAAAIGKVVIEVYGGVAAVTSKPDDIEVEIIDHDNEEGQAYDAFTDFLERADMPQPDGEEG
jgi:hypothetical protein